MSEWGDRVAEKLKANDEQVHVQHRMFLEQQRIKKAHGPKLWHELRHAVRESCEEVASKSKLKFDFLGNDNDRFTVKKLDKSRASLVLTNYPDQERIEYRCGKVGTKEFRLIVTENGQVEYADTYQRHFSPLEIAQRAIEEFLDSDF